MSDREQKDLVLNPNEYAYVLDKTKGLISSAVGPYKMSLSTSDALVIFNEKTKKFEETNFSNAVQKFVSAPENWYVTLKNPTKDGKHPAQFTLCQSPELEIGKKVVVYGPTSFALFPGQMAKVIQGHTLHNNQYLLARVYDADVLDKVVDEDGNESNKYCVGQMLVIKGTEVPFYIPPTGIEVIPENGKYVREAVTLEKLEYCILKDEAGKKTYIHGSAVVFPNPDQEFILNPKTGTPKFKAIELSDISGVYVKVIDDYTENGKAYKQGDELFITGKEQKIYYPCAQHAIIDYDGKVIHHAIALPKGEGRYVLNRLTGEVSTIRGPKMYLPDPRKEVIVRRRLTKKQCELWYPGNSEVLAYNVKSEAEKFVVDDIISMSTSSVKAMRASYSVPLDNGFYGQDNAAVESGGFSRGNSYSKPRTIEIDNKFDGVVAIDVWSGYAINVISKDGGRNVIAGPTTYLMGYDETLESIELSTGTPKDDSCVETTVFLRTENNKVSDEVTVETKDFVDVMIDLSYCVDFMPECKNKWFSVGNYVQYLAERMRSIIKREVKKYDLEDFYKNASEIVRNIVLNVSDSNKAGGRMFTENGMIVRDVEILNVCIESEIGKIVNEHRRKVVENSLKLSALTKEVEMEKQIAKAAAEKLAIEHQNKLNALALKDEADTKQLEYSEKQARAMEDARKKELQAKKNMQSVQDEIQKAELDREKREKDANIAYKKAQNELDIERENAHTEAIKSMFESFTPDLVASMNSAANAELVETVAKQMSPYAMARGESVVDVMQKLLHGTSLEDVVAKMK